MGDDFRKTRQHSRRMRTDRAVTRPISERVATRPIVDRQTSVKTLPSLAVGKKPNKFYRDSKNANNL